MSFWIVTDIGCDLPLSYIQQQDKLLVLPMPYQLDGVPGMNKPGDENDARAFYDKLRQGSVSTTSQVNVDAYYEAFKELTQQGEDVLCLTLSGAFPARCARRIRLLTCLRKKTLMPGLRWWIPCAPPWGRG